MATWQQAEQELARLQGVFDGYTNAVANPDGSVTVAGKRMSRPQAESEQASVAAQVKFLADQLAPIRDAQAGLKRAQEVAQNPITESPTGMSQEAANQAVAEAQKAVAKATAVDVKLAPAGTGGAIRRPTTGRGGRTTPLTAAEKKKLIAAQQPAGGGPKPTQPTGGGVNGGGGGKIGGGKGRGTKIPSDWENIFRAQFPSQSWLLDIDPAKYPDVKKLIQQAVKDQMWLTTESQQKFVAQFNNTSFYKELATTGKVREITQIIGDAGFDSTSFNGFLTKSMNLGWQGDTLRFEVYKEAFRKDDNGQYVNATTVERVKKSKDYLEISGIGKAYFNQVSDDTIQRVLMGEMTDQDVARQQRELAKSRYGHLSNLIDQGLTLEAIGDNYRTQAAQLLEKDPNSIDMSDANYEVALNFGEPDKKRLMTQGEWQRLLRTDRKYGWEKTENAKDEARQLVNNMVKIFGRVV